MGFVAGVILAAIGVCVMIMMAVQVYEFARGRSLLTTKHLILRLVSGVLLIGLIGAIYAGSIADFRSRVVELVYWGVLIVGACAVGLLAVADLQMLERVKHRRRAELYRQLAQLAQQLKERKDRDEN